jgi:4-phospho-D-threonate 3-dehydrogenase / 4-phospho-D-erythronate 3-dehydrogenase
MEQRVERIELRVTTTDLPLIAVTMGDPAGIGPEICLRLLQDEATLSRCHPLILGDASLLRRVAAATGLAMTAPVITAPGDVRDLRTLAAPGFVDIRCLEDAAGVRPGRVDARCGEAAYRCVLAAIAAGQAGAVDAIATAPLNKEALHAAGHRYPGHTEIFAEHFGAARSCMMQYSEEITCSFVTVHVGYADVPRCLTVARILDVIQLTAQALERIRGTRPKLLVCGLNPHAGENGLFGDGEEERVIAPAVAAARAAGVTVDGPVPPDTAFTPARRRAYDGVVCMYHDQGHIPVKMIAFDSAVNTTLGLSVIRTSVDHGTAFDIAWQGKASCSSLISAVRLAVRLVATRDAVAVATAPSRSVE